MKANILAAQVKADASLPSQRPCSHTLGWLDPPLSAPHGITNRNHSCVYCVFSHVTLPRLLALARGKKTADTLGPTHGLQEPDNPACYFPLSPVPTTLYLPLRL